MEVKLKHLQFLPSKARMRPEPTTNSFSMIGLALALFPALCAEVLAAAMNRSSIPALEGFLSSNALNFLWVTCPAMAFLGFLLTAVGFATGFRRRTPRLSTFALLVAGTCFFYLCAWLPRHVPHGIR